MPRAFLVKRFGGNKEQEEKGTSINDAKQFSPDERRIYTEKNKYNPRQHYYSSDINYDGVKPPTHYMGKFIAYPYFEEFVVSSRGVIANNNRSQSDYGNYRVLQFERNFSMQNHDVIGRAGDCDTMTPESEDEDDDDDDDEESVYDWARDYNNNNDDDDSIIHDKKINSNENDSDAKFLIDATKNGFISHHHHHENGHQKLKFGNKPQFQCNQCDKTFKTKYTLNIHRKMPSHTTLKPFVCPTCGKGFRLSSTLCRHKIIHTSQRPHRCHVCQKSFNRSSTLKTHLRTHSNVKEFTCNICGKGFHQKGNLRNHILIHTGEKPYECSVCKKSFNKLSNLKFHMHSHTDQKPYRCRYCKQSFCKRGELKQHIAGCKHDANED